MTVGGSSQQVSARGKARLGALAVLIAFGMAACTTQVKVMPEL